MKTQTLISPAAKGRHTHKKDFLSGHTTMVRVTPPQDLSSSEPINNFFYHMEMVLNG